MPAAVFLLVPEPAVWPTGRLLGSGSGLLSSFHFGFTGVVFHRLLLPLHSVWDPWKLP